MVDNWKFAYHSAAANWLRWQEEYSSSSLKCRPMLNEIEVFSNFCSEYNLSRNIPGDGSEAKDKRKKLLAECRRKVVMKYLKDNLGEDTNVDDFAKTLAEFANQNHS